MSSTAWQWLLIALVVGSFAIENFVSVLNLRHNTDSKSELYDDTEGKRALDYKRANFKLGLASGVFSTALTVLALALGWLGQLDNWLIDQLGGGIPVVLAYAAAVGAITGVLSLPFDIYATFSVEKRFGFNQTTPFTFLTDQLKGVAIGAVLGGAILALLAWLYSALGSMFWLTAWIALTAISLVMFAWGTSIILPLFNKLTELEEGPLREQIIAYCHSQGYSVNRLFVMDGSKRSSKANAFFAGIGKSKTIVLFDTLIEKLTTEEVVAVLAHEVGHYRLKHTYTRFLAGMVQTLALTSLLGWALNFDVISLALGADSASFELGLTGFLLLFSPISTLSGWALNTMSRRHEYEADQFSKQTYSGDELASGLVKISADALTDPNPHPVYVALNYSHPPVPDRITALK